MPIAADSPASAAHLDEPSVEEMRHNLKVKLAQLNGRPSPAAVIPYPRTASATELDAALLPEPRWAVRGLLPQGAALLAGKPKAGKSWLCLDLALAIAAARPALGDRAHAPEPGAVLYLALEDTAFRLQSRLRAALGANPPPANLRFTTRWPRFPEGLAALSAYLQDNRDTRLVIVDTLAKIRSLHTQSASVYAEDYETVGALKSIADRTKITVLIVHHLRKAAFDDPLDAISGSAGLTGAADTILVLTRRRGQDAARLFATGRDLDELELVLRWNAIPAGWTVAAEDAFDLPPWFNAVLRIVRAAPDGCTPAEVAAATDHTANAARVALHRLAQLGRVAKSGSRYVIAAPDPSLDPTPRQDRGGPPISPPDEDTRSLEELDLDAVLP